jgi:Carboxypeptidase regulatory-like domain
MCNNVWRLVAMLALFAGVSAQVNAAEQTAPERYRIRGTMVDAADEHVLSHARVTVALLGGDPLARSVLTGDDGRFDFADLAVGRYELAARCRRYATRKYLQHGDTFASAIVTGPGKDTHEIRFALVRGAAISGVVTDESGEAVRHARVKLITKDLRDGGITDDFVDEAQTNDQGAYRFSGLNAGTYWIAVEARPWYARGVVLNYSRSDAPQGSRAEKQLTKQEESAALDVAYATTYFGNAADIDAAAPIEVKAGDAAVADVSLQPVPAARLRVLTDGNHGILEWRDGQATFSQMQTLGTDGAGSQLLTVTGLPPGGAKIVTTDHATENDDGMSLGLVRMKTMMISGDTEVAVPVEGEGATISGTVNLYRPAASRWVMELEIRGVGGTQTDVATVSADGEFKFSSGRFAAGEYEVMVREPQGAVIVGMTASGATVVGQKVTAQKLVIGAESDVRLAVTVAVGSTRVCGVVTKDGGGVAGVMMLLVPLDFGGPMGLYRRDESDSDGSFAFGNVAEGNYRVVGIAEGWEMEWGKAEVLGKYLARGTKVVVGKQGASGVKVDVQ